jgi:DNA modification methylase
VIDIRCGDALELLRTLEAGSVRCCVTSPPYWGLRDYGTARWEGGDPACDHAGRIKPRRDTSGSPGLEHGRFASTRGTQPAKAYAEPVREECRCGARRIDAQVGLERTPAEYVERMVALFAEVRRVLADDGTLWLNLGDTYSGDRGQASRGGPPSASSTLEGNGHRGGGPKLRAMTPSRRRDDAPCPRSDVAVTGLKPKDLVGIPWRVAFALQADGWYLRSDVIWAKPNPMPESVTDRPTKAHEYLFLLSKSERYYYDGDAIAEQGTGRAPGNTGPHKYAAAYEAGAEEHRTAQGLERIRSGYETRNRRTVWTIPTQPFPGAHFAVMPEALVEPCVLAGSAPGDLVIDPFAGSGTVGVVALRHGRRFVGLELNPEYVQMARKRIAGPLFAEVNS